LIFFGLFPHIIAALASAIAIFVTLRVRQAGGKLAALVVATTERLVWKNMDGVEKSFDAYAAVRELKIGVGDSDDHLLRLILEPGMIKMDVVTVDCGNPKGALLLRDYLASTLGLSTSHWG